MKRVMDSAIEETSTLNHASRVGNMAITMFPPKGPRKAHEYVRARAFKLMLQSMESPEVSLPSLFNSPYSDERLIMFKAFPTNIASVLGRNIP